MKDFLSIKNVTFGYGSRTILEDVSLRFGSGQVVAIMGGSGMGKTTLLKLIGGLLTPQAGEICIAGCRVDTNDQKALYRLRRRMGMLFQFGALFTDLSVFDNVAFPIREQTNLDEETVRDLVLMKLNAVGLRGAAPLMPSEISGGMARRVALARTIALDPALILYDEPFAGLDPISMGVTARLIRSLNDALGATSLMVTHDVEQTFEIADYVYMISSAKVAAQGTPAALRASDDPFVRQFINGLPDGPFSVSCPRLCDRSRVPEPQRRPSVIVNLLAQLGSWVLSLLSSVGRFGIFSGRVLARLGGAGLSPIISQIHFIGNYSLLIISVSGLFVGFVLGLQGYYVLVTYGSEEALGTLVALSLVRELGPVVTALLFAGRAGTALTAEIGLMRSGEQLAAMEMMGVDPIRRVFAPRFIGGFISMPILALIFSAVGIIGAWMVGVLLIGTDNGAFWSQMESAVDVFSDICNGFVKSVVFGAAVTLIALYQGWASRPTPDGVARATTTTVVVSSLLVLGLDFIMTAWMFTTV